MTSIAIRNATPADITLILQFVRELAEYEREPDAVVATEGSLHEALFGPGAVAHAVIAEDAGEALGYAVYFFSFSTWLGKPGLYLEDLYVTPAARGRGIGKRLLTHLARMAVDRGCGRMEWAVLDWNTPAVEFYEAMGAEQLTGLTICRLTGDTLTQAANKAT